MKTKIFFIAVALLIFNNASSQTISPDEVPFSTPGRLQPSYVPVSIGNYAFFATYVVLILIVVVCLVIAVEVKEIQRKNSKKESLVY